MTRRILKSLICANIEPNAIHHHLNETHVPMPGDVALFEVQEIGRHTRIQCADGRNRMIFPGDRIWMAFGHRYASNQFEGYVPDGPRETYHILGMGGAVGEVHSVYQRIEKDGITTLRMVGYGVDHLGNVINSRFRGHRVAGPEALNRLKGRVILAIGSGMDSGKTTSAAMTCRGLTQRGFKVAFFKLTGTIYAKDKWLAEDCGASPALDFSDLGYPSTYLADAAELERLLYTLSERVERHKPDYVVVEIADGVLQRETQMLLLHPALRQALGALVYCCADSLSGQGGISHLASLGLTPTVISGLLTISPLMQAELAATTSIPILDLEALQAGLVHDIIQDGQESLHGIPGVQDEMPLVEPDLPLARHAS